MTSGNTSFVLGSIVRIKLKNFLTYDSVELKPGPFLNVLIGPNGTGKSAIVCAMCLGLAGKPSLLGRASDPKDFIKHRKEEAKIEVELFHGQGNIIIQREITRSKASRWWLNGSPTSQKVIEERVAQLKIQVGNLCQFLPQEKVADFARMSQQELLENTEKSVGKSQLYENHQKLKSARQESKLLATDVDKIREQLEQERQKNARLEQDVKSFNERKAFLEKVKILEMKKPWLQYDFFKTKFEVMKVEKNKKSKELDAERKQFAPLEKQFDQLKQEKDRLEQESTDLYQQIRVKAADAETQRKKMATKSEMIEEAHREYDSKLTEDEALKQKIADLQKQLPGLEARLAQLDSCNDQAIAKNVEEIATELRNVGERMNGVQTQGEALQRNIKTVQSEMRGYEAELKKIKDVSNRRLETLRTLHAHTYEAVVWLRSNSHLFKGIIHEPMIISLNVKNPRDAKLVEMHISFNDLRSFVCENPDDLDLFMKKIKNEQKLKVNTVRAPEQEASSFKPKHPISHFKKYGFERYLQDLITCPEPIMRYLCLMYRVHSVPVGNISVKNNAEAITRECPDFNTFYTPEVQYSIRRSKYNQSVASRNTALREPKALTDSVNMQREQEISDEIKKHNEDLESKRREYKTLQKESEELEIQINQLRDKKRKLMKKKEERKNMENEITTKKQRIQQIMKGCIDIESEKMKLHQQLFKIIKEKCQHLEKMKCAKFECIALAKARVRTSLLLVEHNGKAKVIEVNLVNAKQRSDLFEAELNELKDQVQEVKQQAREKMVEAKRIAQIKDNDNLQEVLMKRGLWEEFENTPTDLEELDAEIHSIKARAEVKFQVDECVVTEYKERQIEVEKMDKILRERESRRHTHQEDISELKDKWMNPLMNLIAEININFSYFFSSLKCCGEVGLSVPENPEDYEKYGICIKVKFRDSESLRELTAQHQSGGERSVATVLYMMALQELSKCPFRVVDEINQGMDPRNERKIFQLVVQTVCKKSSSQYFLLTPKLLPDLDYDDNMTVLCVYNGPHLMDHTDWTVDTFLQRRKRLVD